MAIFTVPGQETTQGGGIFGAPMAQTSSGIFAPYTTQDPSFGLGTPGGWSGATSGYGGTPLGQYMMQKQQELMMAAGVTGVDWSAFDETNPLNDPAVQRQANETAIAKIASANPDLAATLAAKMTGEPDEEKSLWDNFKDVISPVLSVGGKALDLLSRPMRIVPELITDDENDTWYQNIGQALSGNSTASWAEVLDEEMGIDNNIVKAVGGFIGDVLTDPLTYTGFGMLGMGRKVVQTTASKTVMEGVLLKGIKGAPTPEQATAINQLSQALTTAAKISPEAAVAQMARHIRNIPGISQQIMDEAIRAGHETAQAIGRGISSRAFPVGMVGEGAEYSARDILKQAASQRVGREARAAGSALGGVRLKGGIPFMGYRYSFTSGAIPFTEGRKFVGLGGNFFRGTSGMTRLQQWLNNNPTISPQVREQMYTTWTKKGFRGFANDYQQAAREMGGGAMHLGSMFYEASSRMGRVTAGMAPRATAYRHAGLVGVHAANASRSALALKNKLINASYELFAEVDDLTGEVLPAVNQVDLEKSVRKVLDNNQPEFIEYWEAIDNPAILKLSDEEIIDNLTFEAQARRANKERSVEAQLQQGTKDEAWANREMQRIADEFDAEVVQADQKLKRMRNADKLVSDDMKPHLDNWRRGIRQIKEMGNQHGDQLGDRTTTIAFQDVVNTNDVPRFVAAGNPQVAKADTYATLQGAGPRVSDAVDTEFGVHGLVWDARSPAYREVNINDFREAQATKARANLPKERQPFLTWADDLSPEERAGMRTFLNETGDAGYGVASDGEIVMVFNAGATKGQSKAILEEAIANGGTHLYHFDSGLTKLYDDAGFKEVAREPFNDAYAPKGWDTNTMGRPDYIRREIGGGDDLPPLPDRPTQPAYRDETLEGTGKGDPGIEFAEKPNNLKSKPEWASRKTIIYRDSAGNPQGRLDFYTNADDEPIVITRVFVDKSARRQGIATKMFAEAKERGYDLEAVSGKGGLTPDGLEFAKGRRAKTPSPASPGVRRRVAVRAENPLYITDDIRSDAPLLDAWDAELRGLFNNPEIRKVFTAENKLYLDDAEWQKFVDSEVQLHKSRKAVDAGYDSIVKVSTKDGQEVVEGGVMLIDPTMKRGIGMASISDDVGQAYGGRGYVPIIASDELMKSKYGERYGKPGQDIRSGELVHEKERLTDESIFDMNERLKDKYGLEGDAIVTDPGEIYNLYATRVATGAAQRQLGVAAEQMHSLYGRAAPEMVATLNRYMNKGFLDHGAVNKLSLSAAKHYDLHTQRQEKLIARQEQIMNEQAAVIKRLQAQARGEGLTKPAVTTRRVAGARVSEGVDLGKQLTAAQKRKLVIMQKLKAAQKGEKYQQLETELRNVNKEIDSLMAQRNAAKTGKLLPSTPDKVLDAVGKHSDALEAEAERLSKLTLKEQRMLEAAENAYDAAAGELKKIRTRLETHMAKATPAFTSDATKKGYEPIVGIPGLEGMHAHPYIAAEFSNALKGKGLSDARKEWRRFQGVWKSWATVYYPGFHARNNMGAWFNNWLGGVGAGHYAYSMRISNARRGGKYAEKQIGKELGRRFGIDPFTTWGQLAGHLDGMGVSAKNSIAFIDMQDSVGALRRWQSGTLSVPEKITARAGRTKYARASRKMTEVTENFHRQAAFLAGLEATGGDFAGARAFTMMRHGDYEDLNDFEHFIKDVVPFYKWMRTNIPFQIHQLLENPAKQLATVKASNAMLVAAGEDPDTLKGKLPRAAREAFNIGLPRGADGDEMLQLISLDLPMADLFQGGSDYLSSALPLVRPLIEAYVLKHNIFTGAPITGKRKPLAGWMQLPGIAQLLSPMTETDAQGNVVMSDQTQTVLNIIPIFSRFRNWAFADEKSTQRRTAALISAAFGVRPEDFNEEDLLNHEKAFFYEFINPELENARNLGMPLPEPDMLNPSIYSWLGFDQPVEEAA